MTNACKDDMLKTPRLFDAKGEIDELLENGYVNSNKDTRQRMRKLREFLPMIQRVQMEGKSIN